MTNEVFEYLKSRVSSFEATTDELDAVIEEHNRRCELTQITIGELEKLKEEAELGRATRRAYKEDMFTEDLVDNIGCEEWLIRLYREVWK